VSPSEILALAMFASFIALVFTGFPIAWILGGLAVLFTALAIVLEVDLGFATGVDWNYSALAVDRMWGVMENWVMVALPMFILMGLILDRSGIARALLTSVARLLGPVRGGLAITITVIGVLLAATTGIIGASVVLLALLGMPVMLDKGYDRTLAAGTVCAVGTLGILIPPSIMLVLMADRMSMSVGDLFMGAVLPGTLLSLLYILYLLGIGLLQPERAPAARGEPIDLSALLDLVKAIVPAALLILAVLGSIFFGVATPTEAAGMGAALNAATAMAAYTLSDRASWLNFGNRSGMALLYERDPGLFNQYGYLPINANKHPHINASAAAVFEAWLTSRDVQAFIGAYTIDDEVLFRPNARPAPD